MRVTKLIREYVEEQIEKAIPIKNVSAYDELRKAGREAQETINKKIAEYGKALIKEAVEANNFPEDWVFHLNCGLNYCNFSTYGTKLWQENDRCIREAKKKREAAIKSVLLELELGATKNELTELIAKAIEEEG